MKKRLLKSNHFIFYILKKDHKILKTYTENIIIKLNF
mgnify:CR=1 FL=1